MKIIIAILIVVTFSNCGLISAFKIRDAMQEEKIQQHSFKKEIPFREEKGLLVVKVLIENKIQNFIFDTGASTVLDDNFAKTIKYRKVGVQKHRDTGGEKKKLKIVKLDKISVGNIDFSSIVASISNLDKLQKQTCINFVGILGANMMNKAVWQIDYKRKIIVLTDTRDSLNQQKDKKTFGFYAIGKGTPKIRLSVNDKYLEEAELDTGSSGGIDLPEKTLQNIPTSNKFIIRHGISSGMFSERTETSQTTIIPNLTLGRDFEAQNVPITFNKVLSYALIGNKFLKDYLVTIDWKYQEITFSSFQPNINNQFNTFGFTPKFINRKIVIGSIIENSSADKAGLELNDQILQINETDFRNPNHSDYCDLQSIFVGNSNELLITVKKEGKEIKRKLNKTDLAKEILNFQN